MTESCKELGYKLLARKPRIESKEGLYHIIKRGNYRRDIFDSAKTKRAFEWTIFEAGMAHPESGYKKALIKDYRVLRPVMQMEARELREFNELEWEMLLAQCLRILKKTKEEINAERKTTEWELAIALLIKERTSARNGWIASRLNM